MTDQAEKLREIVAGLKGEAKKKEDNAKKEKDLAEVYAITSGKGGVGKSNFTANLALALQDLGEKVVVFDADLGMANLDVILGVVSRYNLLHVINGEKSIEDIIINGPKGLALVPGGSGMEELANLSKYQIRNLIDSWRMLEQRYDLILIDTAAGLASNVVDFILAADQIIIIATPEPTSITDAYGVIKALSKHDIDDNIKLVINQAESGREANNVSKRLLNTAEEFLNLDVEFIGSLPKDDKVSKAVKNKTPFIIDFPKSKVSKELNDIAIEISSKNNPSPKKKGFFSRIFGLGK